MANVGSGNLLVGIGVGAGALWMASKLWPVVAAAGRPLVKGLLKQALHAAEAGRAQAANLAESLEDLLAEVRAEVEQELDEKRKREGAAMRQNGASPEETGNGAAENRGGHS